MVSLIGKGAKEIGIINWKKCKGKVDVVCMYYILANWGTPWVLERQYLLRSSRFLYQRSNHLGKDILLTSFYLFQLNNDTNIPSTALSIIHYYKKTKFSIKLTLYWYYL